MINHPSPVLAFIFIYMTHDTRFETFPPAEETIHEGDETFGCNESDEKDDESDVGLFCHPFDDEVGRDGKNERKDEHQKSGQ